MIQPGNATFRFLTLSLAAVAMCGSGMLAGCSKPKDVVRNDRQAQSPDPKPPSGPTGGSTTSPEGPSTPNANTEPGEAKPGPLKKYDFNVPKIASVTPKGWSHSSVDAVELGAKVDAAMRSLKGAYSEATMMIELPEGKGQVTTKNSFDNSDRFYVEYVLPNAKFEPQRVVADGKQLVRQEGGKWQEPVSISSVKSGPADRANLVAEFPFKFPGMVLDGVCKRRDVWGPLIQAWASGEGGYKTTIEQRDVGPKGSQRKIYRVYAESEADGRKIEAIFDGNRYVPVTIRVEDTSQEGKPIAIQWQAMWSFNKPLDPKKFLLPKS